MAQANINIRMDEELKHNMESLCQELGINLTTAVTVFFKKAVRERGLPFQVSIDPFYSETNQARLREAAVRMNAGLGTEHELIEVDE